MTLGRGQKVNIINMSISKIFIPNFVSVLTNIKKIENILNRIFILLPRSCPGVGLQDAGGVKNFSLGICDGAPSTSRSSFFIMQQMSLSGNVLLKNQIRLSIPTNNYLKYYY